MARERRLEIIIAGDATGAQRAFASVDQQSQTMGQKLENFGRKASIAVTLPVIAGATAIFGLASAANEQISKTNAVFDESADVIHRWAETTATSAGLAKTEALEAASNFGNMFVQLGVGSGQAADLSTSMVELAADFASFHNADISEVLTAQSAAFRGEYDSLQRFLPLINAASVEQKALEMTGKTSTDMLTAQEKALAVNALMFEGAGDALGDFDRTSDSAANKQRILTAQFKDAATELGQNLLPIGQQILGWVSTLAEKFNNLSPTAQRIILVVIGLAAVIGPLITVITAVSTALTFLAANPIVLIIVGIAALVAGLIWAYQNVEGFRNVVDALGRFLLEVINWALMPYKLAFDGITEALGAVRDAAQWLWNNVLQPFGDFLAGIVDDALTPFGEAWHVIEAAIGFVIDKVETLIGWLEKAIGWIDKFNAGAAGITGGVAKLVTDPGSIGAGGQVPASFYGVPAAASGGVTMGQTLALVGDNPSGREAIVPLERAGEFGFGAGGGVVNNYKIHLTLNGDADERSALRFSEKVYEGLVKLDRRNGLSSLQGAF